MGANERRLKMRVHLPKFKASIRLLKCAFVLLSLFVLTHACEGQSHVSALAGVHSGSSGQALIGFFYVSMYLAVITLVPILFIASSILWFTRLGKVRWDGDHDEPSSSFLIKK